MRLITRSAGKTMEVAGHLVESVSLMIGNGSSKLVTPAVWENGWPQTPAEFEKLVEAFQDRLVRYAYGLVGNIAEAEDVAQEVFVRAYAERDRRGAVANVSAYLYKMTSNGARDLLRRRKVRAVSAEGSAEILEIPSHHPDAATIAAAAEENRRAEALLCHVSPEQAEVIRLRVFDELPPREIAELLGCEVATVKSRLRYGMEKLRSLVMAEQEGKR